MTEDLTMFQCRSFISAAHITRAPQSLQSSELSSVSLYYSSFTLLSFFPIHYKSPSSNSLVMLEIDLPQLHDPGHLGKVFQPLHESNAL